MYTNSCKVFWDQVKSSQFDQKCFKVFNLWKKYCSSVVDFPSDFNKSLPQPRKPNIPEFFTQFIIAKILYFHFKWEVYLPPKGADMYLIDGILKKKVELKAFSSDGPSTITPVKNWNTIDQFLVGDFRKFGEDFVTLYEVDWPKFQAEDKSAIKALLAKSDRRIHVNFQKAIKEKKSWIKLLWKGNFKKDL